VLPGVSGWKCFVKLSHALHVTALEAWTRPGSNMERRALQLLEEPHGWGATGLDEAEHWAFKSCRRLPRRIIIHAALPLASALRAGLSQHRRPLTSRSTRP
jgi:hypothetical protein